MKNWTLFAKRQKPKKRARIGSKKPSLISAAWAIIIIAGIFSCVYLIAEPWDRKVYGNVDGEYFYGDEIVLAVGESVVIEVPLGENEKIASIETADPDVLHISGTTVTAKGQFWTAITVKTSEIEIPQRPVKQVKIFGWDISQSYDKVRTWLRGLFGIARQPEQTELRELNTHEINVIVVGYETQQGSKINVTRGVKKTDPTNLMDNEEDILYSENSQLVKILASDTDEYSYEAVAVGDTAIQSFIGFWKPVSSEAYNRYLEKNPQAALYMQAARSACACSKIAFSHEGMIFVIQRQVNYEVSVAEPKAPRPPGQGGGSGGGGGGGGGGSGGGDDRGRGNEGQPNTLLGMVNAARANEKLSPLSWSAALGAAAQIRVQEITEVMSHTRPNGELYYTVNPSIIYGENLAAGFSTAQRAFDAWMDSPGHRASILNPRFRTIGYAHCVIDEKYRYYWAMEFGL